VKHFLCCGHFRALCGVQLDSAPKIGFRLFLFGPLNRICSGLHESIAAQCSSSFSELVVRRHFHHFSTDTTNQSEREPHKTRSLLTESFVSVKLFSLLNTFESASNCKTNETALLHALSHLLLGLFPAMLATLALTPFNHHQFASVESS
jgi:hypothetical protein